MTAMSDTFSPRHNGRQSPYTSYMDVASEKYAVQFHAVQCMS
jgi:hypothetical protein